MALSKAMRPNFSVRMKNGLYGGTWSRKKASTSGINVTEIPHGAKG